MAGLVPAIHVFTARDKVFTARDKNVGARDIGERRIAVL
jgi:hypothetical protein